MRLSRDTQDQAWIRDQTARILHRHILSGKHFRLELDALLSRIARLRASVSARDDADRNTRRTTKALSQGEVLSRLELV